MNAHDRFMTVLFLALVIGLVTGHLINRRRERSIAEFECKRRERKAEVERASRKSL